MQFNKSEKIDSVSTDQTKSGFRILTVLAIAGFSIMSYFLVLAINHGNLAIEGPNLLNMPWGFLSLIDIYTGLILISYWVLWRENNFYKSIPWIILLLFLGNMATCMYVLKCLLESKGEPSIFFQGKN